MWVCVYNNIIIIWRHEPESRGSSRLEWENEERPKRRNRLGTKSSAGKIRWRRVSYACDHSRGSLGFDPDNGAQLKDDGVVAVVHGDCYYSYSPSWTTMLRACTAYTVVYNITRHEVDTVLELGPPVPPANSPENENDNPPPRFEKNRRCTKYY